MKALLLLSVLLCCAADVDVDVQTPLGVIRGTERSSTAKVFRGVRFAEPPKGALRFVAPVAVANWSGVYDATAFGFGCPQLHHNPDVPQPQDEDCLFLNVFVPPTSCGPDLAVMFWIHGGSFAEGGGSLYFYDGENLAAGTCTIVVTHNYRYPPPPTSQKTNPPPSSLGALGFLVADGVGGDMGIDDQRAALRWVRDNIAAFGGNPSNVCVFGQSAGAMSISWGGGWPLTDFLAFT
jgi:para-nitrobenzyl esterase